MLSGDVEEAEFLDPHGAAGQRDLNVIGSAFYGTAQQRGHHSGGCEVPGHQICEVEDRRELRLRPAFLHREAGRDLAVLIEAGPACPRTIVAERDEHLSAQDAIRKAALLRFRPIMMTTMAALLGGLPLALGSGTGAEIRQPLGYSMVGGLIVSQALTLFTTPVIYIYLDMISEWLKGHSGGLNENAEVFEREEHVPHAEAAE